MIFVRYDSEYGGCNVTFKEGNLETEFASMIDSLGNDLKLLTIFLNVLNKKLPKIQEELMKYDQNNSSDES